MIGMKIVATNVFTKYYHPISATGFANLSVQYETGDGDDGLVPYSNQQVSHSKPSSTTGAVPRMVTTE